MVTAALGGEFEVPTIDGGKTRVKVPEGTQSGRRFRLQGKGMPVLRSKQTGDMYVQVVVETPQNLTKRQRELLDRVREAVVEGHAARNRRDSSARSRNSSTAARARPDRHAADGRRGFTDCPIGHVRVGSMPCRCQPFKP